jgi:thiamine transport system permease protein
MRMAVRLGPLAFLALALLYPLVAILSRTLGWGSGSIFEPIVEILSDRYYLGRLWFTFWQAAASTLLALVIGLPCAYVFARFRFPGRSVLLALTTVPFMMPPIVMALGFIALVGPTGLMNTTLVNTLGLSEPPIRILHTFVIILIAHAVYEFAIVVRLVSAVWANLDERLLEAGRVLGASSWEGFVRITLPLLVPAIGAAAALVFLFTFTSFGVVLILGGPDFSTLEVAIYETTTKLFRLGIGGALALVQIGVTFLTLLLYARLQIRATNRMALRPRRDAAIRLTTARHLLSLGMMVIVVFGVLSPLAALIIRSFISLDGGVSIAGYLGIFSNERNSFLFVSPFAAMRNSIGFGIVTVTLALPLGTLAAYALRGGRTWWRSPLDALYMLPLGVSAVTLGLGYLVGFKFGSIDLRSTWVPIVLAHALVAYPFVLRVVLSTLRVMKPHLGEAARVLGAGRLRTVFALELPILSPALLVGAVFAFAVSLGEFGATLLLNRPEYTTMPMAIFRYLGRPGSQNLAEALAMSSILVVVAAGGFLLIERARYRGWGEF